MVLDEDGLVDAVEDFTEQFWEAKKRPWVQLDPWVFRCAEVDGRRKRICPHSWPSSSGVAMILEQVLADTAGMQPRYFHNHLPWVMQPAIYVDCVQTVMGAKAIVDEHLKREKETGSAVDKSKGGS